VKNTSKQLLFLSSIFEGQSPLLYLKRQQKQHPTEENSAFFLVMLYSGKFYRIS